MWVTREPEKLWVWIKRKTGETQGHLEYYWNSFRHWLKYDAWWL